MHTKSDNVKTMNGTDTNDELLNLLNLLQKGIRKD